LSGADTRFENQPGAAHLPCSRQGVRVQHEGFVPVLEQLPDPADQGPFQQLAKVLFDGVALADGRKRHNPGELGPVRPEA